jgi:zinc protease
MTAAATTTTSRADKVQKVRAACGVTAWLVEDYAVPLVAMDFAFRGGASQDPANKPGLATMLAGLLDEGAGALESEAFHRAMTRRRLKSPSTPNAIFSAAACRRCRAISTAPSNCWAMAVTQARLDAEPIERVRGQLAASLKREINDPDTQAGRLWRRFAFPDHAYGRPVNGDLASLPSLTRDDLVDLRSRLLARDNLVISVVGAIDAATLARHLDAVFGALPENAACATPPAVEIAHLGRRELIDLDVPQATIRFGRPGIARRDPDFMAAMVTNHILGGGVFTARLFKEVREKRGLAYSVHSHLQTDDASAFFVGATSTKNERAGESLGVIEDEIRKLADEGPSEDELDKAKKYLIGSYALRFDTSTKIAGQLTHLQLEGFGVDYLDARNGLIAAVTRDETIRAGRRLFGDGKLLVAIAGRPQGV